MNRIARSPENLFEGVEFGPVPAELATTFNTSIKLPGPFATPAPDEFDISEKIKAPSGRDRL